MCKAGASLRSDGRQRPHVEAESVLLTNLKGRIMKKIISIMGVLMFAVGLSACNTMQGVGKDVERGGEKMQNAAERNK